MFALLGARSKNECWCLLSKTKIRFHYLIQLHQHKQLKIDTLFETPFFVAEKKSDEQEEEL
jgi:hypothetical protein